ncbi:hypothetical protein BC826DRAFT_187012 [Russula brevipes]|nr:hypothetical protein BC826DRAFT_187012 [Russula brevipes]
MRDMFLHVGFDKKDILVFKPAGEKYHTSHITDDVPDYTDAFRSSWNDNGTTLWPCVRLAGVCASEEKSLDAQRKQAYLYLHYLLLARPDLHVVQGILTSEQEVKFLLGIGGSGICAFVFKWGKEDLHRLMYAFIYRLYDPGHFLDASYVDMVPNLEDGNATYTVRVTEGNGGKTIITGLLPIHASNPFGTRTHVLSNPDSEVIVNDKRLTVVKDQLCRIGTGFNERDILSRVHAEGRVPGVVEAICSEDIVIPGSIYESRIKRRVGMWQNGTPFMGISSLQQALETVFDTLEVLRYLRFKRSILHRDISQGNVLHLRDHRPFSSGAMSGTGSGGVNETVEPMEVPLCFVKNLLGESTDPQETSLLLIDFNHAEDLDTNQDLGLKRTTRTGTPVFIARGVELGGAVPLPMHGSNVPPVPESPERYSECHPDRIRKFPFVDFIHVRSSTTIPQWCHELDHDAESVFWLLLYWVVCAQPKESGEEPMNRGIWVLLTGSAHDRNSLVRADLHMATHSLYAPLSPLLEGLASLLVVDRLWLEGSDPRRHVEYLCEAFQRLILGFILAHRNSNFMTREVDDNPRLPSGVSERPNLSLTSSLWGEGQNRNKRLYPDPSIQQDERKRSRK